MSPPNLVLTLEETIQVDFSYSSLLLLSVEHLPLHHPLIESSWRDFYDISGLAALILSRARQPLLGTPCRSILLAMRNATEKPTLGLLRYRAKLVVTL